jgi:UDP-N-acetylmuramate dehydrogenase
MKIKNNITLKPFNTFGIDVNAAKFASICSVEDLQDVLNTNPSDLLVLGGGSNLLLTKDVNALVLQINIKGIRVVSSFENRVQIEVACYCTSSFFVPRRATLGLRIFEIEHFTKLL